MGMDQPWALGLLLKPVVGVLIFVVVFAIPILLVRVLRTLFPNGRIKDFLFRERGGHSAAARADAEHGVLNDSPLLGREHGKDSTRL